jgi:hypothetical protein
LQKKTIVFFIDKKKLCFFSDEIEEGLAILIQNGTNDFINEILDYCFEKGYDNYIYILIVAYDETNIPLIKKIIDIMPKNLYENIDPEIKDFLQTIL